jgi:hypothetical protein
MSVLVRSSAAGMRSSAADRGGSDGAITHRLNDLHELLDEFVDDVAVTADRPSLGRAAILGDSESTT